MLGVLATLALAVPSLVTAQATHDQQRSQAAIDQQTQITDRFNKAVEQLGAIDNLERRLGGIYSLERIARDSSRDHPTVMEVLSTFVRESTKRACRNGSVPVAADAQAALTVIGRRDAQQDTDPVDLAQACLLGTDLLGTFTGANLDGADLTSARLYGANLHGANLSGTLEDARLRNADLTSANLYGADLTYARLRDADLTSANLRFADLTGTYFRGANLHGADLARTRTDDLDGPYFFGADLTGANFTGADLTGANFTGANLTGANFTGANLTRVKLSQVIGLETVKGLPPR